MVRNKTKTKSKGKGLPLFLKFVISIVWDLLDFTIFRIPVIGTVTDLISIPLAIALWGPLGLITSWEVLDPTDQLDAEIPTMTIIGILTILKGD
ncbi:MAG: hypothetical protein OIN86_13015 [Candidatus Methanoperedens sp.]|nr:hypothetical protein [Candidatus Methanoperedens sp.]CAG0948805.1 hypothetical protein METP1_00058 [Methanosarcinales archaeon]